MVWGRGYGNETISEMADVESLEGQARQRKEKLKALRAKKAAQQGPEV